MVENDLFFKENVKKSFFEAKKHADEMERQIKENRRLIDAQESQIELLIVKLDEIAQEIRELGPNHREKEEVPQEEKGSIHTYIHTLNTYTHPKHNFKIHSDQINKMMETLTKQELFAFLTIYQLEEDLNRPISYSELSKKMGLSEGCIRTYLRSMVKKDLPIIKKKYNNKTIFLSISEDFRNLNYKDKLVDAYYGRDPGQKRLF